MKLTWVVEGEYPPERDPRLLTEHLRAVLATLSDGKVTVGAPTIAAEAQDKNVLVNSASPGWAKTDMGGEDATSTVEEGSTQTFGERARNLELIGSKLY